MPTPYVVITLVENGWTIAVNGVLCPQTFIATSPQDVTERLLEILPNVWRRCYELSVPQPGLPPKEDPS